MSVSRRESIRSDHSNHRNRFFCVYDVRIKTPCLTLVKLLNNIYICYNYIKLPILSIIRWVQTYDIQIWYSPFYIWAIRDNNYSSMASKLITICWIRTDSQQDWKSFIASNYRKFSTNIKMKNYNIMILISAESCL